MDKWQPVTVDELEAIVEKQLVNCSPRQRAAFASFRVPFYFVPIHRLGALERVLVVAHLPSGLLYFEDVEDGFEVGNLNEDGALHPQPVINRNSLMHYPEPASSDASPGSRPSLTSILLSAGRRT